MHLIADIRDQTCESVLVEKHGTVVFWRCIWSGWGSGWGGGRDDGVHNIHMARGYAAARGCSFPVAVALFDLGHASFRH